MPAIDRKPLAHAAAAGRRQSMTVRPTRWPEALWERFEQRAVERGVGVSEVVRECAIAGLGFIEAQDAVQSHRGNTRVTRDVSRA